jgi:hypothetical protein
LSFDLVWTKAASKQYSDIKEAAQNVKPEVSKSGKRHKSSKQEGLLKQVNGCLAKLKNDPKYPGLNSHPYTSLIHPRDKKLTVWESYVQNATPGAYRVFWSYGPEKGQIELLAITPHP